MPTDCTVDDALDIDDGNAVCLVGWDALATRPRVGRATGARLATSKTVFGIAPTGATDGNLIQVLVAGEVADNAVTLLGAGNSRIVATNINAASPLDQCKLVRVERPDGSEFVVGTCDEAGNLAVQPRASRETSDRMVLNVRSFGAVGDDDADDTAAFQDALTALGASGGGVLFVPLGTYRITDTLAVPLNTSLTGEEPGDYLTSQGSLLRFRTLGDGIFFEFPVGNGLGPLVIRDLGVEYAVPEWRAGASFAVGDLLLPRERSQCGVVLRAIAAGATGTTEPAWPVDLGATIADNGVTWEVAAADGAYVSTWTAESDYAMRRLVQPRTLQGTPFFCATSGRSDVAEPAWDPTLGVTTADGTTAWRPLYGAWAVGVAVVAGDLMQAQGHVFVCTAAGTTTAAPAGGWDTTQEAVNAEAAGTVVWQEVGVLANGERVKQWHPTWTVAAGALTVPVRPNGRAYVRLGGTVTGATEPAFPLGVGQQVADGDGVWECTGLTGSGIHLERAAHLRVERARLNGWVTGIWLDGSITVDVSHCVFGTAAAFSRTYGPFGSDGVRIGAADPEVESNGAVVRHSTFNAPETGVYDQLGATHHVHDNSFAMPDFGQCGRVGGVGAVVGSRWVSNVSADSVRGHAFLWVDRYVSGLELRGNFLTNPGAHGLVFDSTVNGLVLEANHFACGAEDIPPVRGARRLTGANLVAANTYLNDTWARFDAPVGGSTVACERDPTGVGYQVVGLNTATPAASLDLQHGGGNALPAMSVHDETYSYFEHWVRNAAAPQKQELRYRTPNLAGGTEGGAAVLLEAAGLSAGETTDVCAVDLPDDATALASWTVSAKHAGATSGRTVFKRAQMILVAAGAVSFVGTATDEVGPIDEPGSTPFPAAAATLSNPAGTTIAVHLVAPVAAPDESAWQTELRVVVLEE